jgi:hypothetical protein
MRLEHSVIFGQPKGSMNVNADTDGLLKALQKLDKKDRSLFVEYLPAEKLRNVLLLCLGEKDEAPRTSYIATFDNPRNSSLPLMALQEQLLTHPPLALQQVGSAQKPVDASRKRGTFAASSNDTKRTKTNAGLIGSTGKGASPIVVKEEQEIIEIASDAEEPEAEANQQPKTKKVQQSADLQMYLRVPTGSGHDMLKDSDDLPVLVQVELKRRFEEMWSFNERRTQDYAKCTLNPTRSMDKPWCIRNQIIRSTRGRRTMYSQGGKLNETADDKCIHARQPCAHFIWYRNQYVIRLVPLPEALRYGKKWTEIEYWVL